MKVLTFGELLLRLSAPGYTKLLQKDSFDATFCGAEANVAVSLANFGVECQFITVLPDNNIARAALNSLRYFGIDVNKCIFKQGRLGLYYLEKGASQRPSKIIYDRKYSSFSLSNSLDFDWKSIFEGVSWFHWTGINPALSDELPTILQQACIEAKSRNITISCDLNYRKTLWNSQKAVQIMGTLLPYVDICIANEEDAEKALGIVAQNNDVESGCINSAAYEYVAKSIIDKYGCKKVAFTLRESFSANKNGWSGLLFDNELHMYVSNHYMIDIVDRVGGGDSFSGALIYSLVSGKSNQDSINFATAASCLKQTIEGDFNRISVSDVDNLLKSGGNGRVQR